MQSPLIDIAMPTYNSNPEYMVQAIESVLAQTEARWRMYVHDDASVTDITSIIQPYLKDPRISWHPNRKKLGIGGNWNATMQLGSSPYLQFLFPDDLWEPWFLERALKAMEEHPSVGMVSLHHTYFCDKGDHAISAYKQLEECRLTNFAPGKHNGKDILGWWLEHELHPNIIGEPDFVMFRRNLMNKVGRHLEDMPQNLDVEYSLRCLLEADWYFITENCGHFRVHEDATSAVNQREGKGVFDRFRCFEELLKRLPRGELRKLTIDARNRALTDMAKKYLARKKAGKTIQTGGSGENAFKEFAVKHPLLIASSLVKAWRQS